MGSFCPNRPLSRTFLLIYIRNYAFSPQILHFPYNMSRQRVAVGSSPSPKPIKSPITPIPGLSQSTHFDPEAAELGLNSLDLESIFSQDSRSPSPRQNLSHPSPIQMEITADVEDLKRKPGENTEGRLISFVDEYGSRTKSTSLPVSTSNIGSQGHLQGLEEQLTQAKETITALKKEIQELRWSLETERVEEDKHKCTGIDMIRGQLVEIERERDKLQAENERLREIMSGVMREKVQWSAVKEENSRLKRELAAFQADFPVNSSIPSLKDAQSSIQSLQSKAKSLEFSLNLSRKENEMLISQAKSATSLLESFKTQQESAVREAAEYRQLFLGKQEAYSRLMKEFTVLKQGKLQREIGEKSPVKGLREEVRRRLNEKLTKM